MKYRLSFDDKTFIIVDDDYVMCLYKNVGCKPKRVTVKNFLKFWHYLYDDYVFIDNPRQGEFIPLTFSLIEEPENSEYPLNMRLKYSEDIKIGDLVEGPDGPRYVAKLHRGVDQMYDIIVDGHTYTVNGGHILHLRDTETNECLDISVEVYVLMDDDFKSHFVMEKIDV